MALDIRTTPYYDDFDPEKNFHRILFKPGYAVQSRELTQLQTILQEQIKRFGNHIFKDGSVVLGCAETFKFDVPYVKIENYNHLNIAISDASFSQYMSTLLDSTITNQLGVEAKIIYIAVTSENERVLYLNYTSASSIDNSTTFSISNPTNEVLTVTGFSNKFVVKGDTTAVGTGSLFTLTDGVVYSGGNFVLHAETTAVVDYFESAPTKKVGYRIIESAVSSDDDVTLLDPASGSYNYAAPGADRYKLETQLESYNVTQTTDEGFHLLFEIEEGKVKRAFNKPQYAELQKVLAQRTFDESGNYTVNGLNVSIREHYKTDTNNGKFTEAQGGNLSKLLYGIEPGKAYVEGYDIELSSTEYLPVDKALDTIAVEEKAISTTFGNYVLVTMSTGAGLGNWNITQNISVNLRNAANITKATARVRLVEWSTADIYKLYLYDITPIVGVTIEDLQDVTNSTTLVTNIVDTATSSTYTASVSGTFTIFEPTYNSLIFPTTFKAIASFAENTSDFYYWKDLGTISTPSQIGTVSLSLNEEWAANSGLITNSATIKENYLITDATTSRNITTTTALSITSGVLTIQPASATSVKLLAKVRVTNKAPLNKNLQRTTVKFRAAGAYNAETSKVYLGIADVFDIESIYMAIDGIAFPTVLSGLDDGNWTDVTSDFTLERNQNDNYYATSYIQYNGNLTGKKLVITFRYFVRDTVSTSGYMTKDSYNNALIDADPTGTPNITIDDLTIYTYQIPVYTSTSGITYDLRDVIDFRPTVLNRTGYESQDISTTTVIGDAVGTPNTTYTTLQSNIIVPARDEQFIATLSYYLSRTDKVVLTRDGVFQILQGATTDDTPHMVLADIFVSPYPSLSTYVAKRVGREDYTSYVRLHDNRRYTMRDIGEIEQRVSRLEYFAALTIMEAKAANLSILDPSDSSVMAKKGILVDAFDGHGVGNIFDTEYSAAIDTDTKELRPSFTIENIQFEPVNAVSGELASLSYETTPSKILISNALASKVRSCGNALLGNYQNALVQLNPPQDMLFDDTVRPDVQTNFQGNNDGWEFNTSPFNIHWNNWRKIWQGKDYLTTSTVAPVVVNNVQGLRAYNQTAQLVSDITRSMIIANNLPENNIRVLGNKVFDISIVPFIREQVINFVATGLRPNTIVKAYFDDEDVSTMCRAFTLPEDITSASIVALNDPVILSLYESFATSFGDTLVVDASGSLIGQFKVESNKYRTGNRIFKLIDDIQTTQAATQFTASGIAQYNDSNITSTRIPLIRQDTLTINQNTIIGRLTLSNPSSWSPTSYGDPMAQTFIVEGETDGVFLSKVDLYFNAISSTKGIAIQLREVINGYPGNKIVPFSTKFLEAGNAALVASTTASSATTFTFDSPVYLKNNVEYALVLLPENNTTEYQVWVSELGANKLGTSQLITQQPYVGVLFIPNNNTTWAALENEDLKFTLHKAQYNTVDQEINFRSAPIDYVSYSTSGTHPLAIGDTVRVYTDTQNTFTNNGGTATIGIQNSTITGTNTEFINDVSIGDRVRVLLPVTGNMTGSITVTDTSTTVSGSGTSFSTDLRQGDILLKDTGVFIGKVKSVETNTSLTLEESYSGTTGSVNFKIRSLVGVVKQVVSDTSITIEEDYPTVLTSGYTGYIDITSAEGYVSQIKNDLAHIYITSGRLYATDYFYVRTFVTGDLVSTKITIDSIEDPIITAVSPNFGTLLLSPITDITWTYNAKDSSGVVSTSEVLKNNTTIELARPYTVYSYSSNNGEGGSSIPSIKLKATLSSSNISLTPIIDIKKMSMLALKNTIDSESTPSISTYITRAVVLDETVVDGDLCVFMDIKMPETCSVKVYANLDSAGWTEMSKAYPITGSILNRTVYQEYSYRLPTVQSYTTFAVKVEMYSTNISKIPAIKQFRAISVE